MPWVRMDDGYPEHPKVDQVGPLAAWLNVCAWAYCARNLTDGFVPTDRALRLAQVSSKKLVAALVTARLWEPVEGGYMVHDYLAYNPSREQVQAERGMRQVRKDLYSDPFMRSRIKKRDEDLCRYCGKGVAWDDRKSPRGGTYDHVDPRGGNSDENLVVACRGCNSSKGQRTPEEAGMTLRPVPPHRNGITAGSIKYLDGISEGNQTESSYPYPYPSRTPLNDDPNPARPGPAVSRERAHERPLTFTNTTCWKCLADQENGALQGHPRPCEYGSPPETIA